MRAYVVLTYVIYDRLLAFVPFAATGALATLLLGLGALWFWLRGGVAPTTAGAPVQTARAPLAAS